MLAHRSDNSRLQRIGAHSLSNDRVAQLVLALAVVVWTSSVLTTYTVGYIFAAGAIPLFLIAIAVRPTKTHIGIAAVGIAWGCMWIAIVFYRAFTDGFASQF